MRNSTKNSSPTRSRDKVLQTLYEMELAGKKLEQVLKNHSLEKTNLFYQEMLKGIEEDKGKIDHILSENIDRPIERLDPIERNALRIAIYEILNKDIDKTIIINEAIRMSKKYGSSDGYKLVNAVLDNLIKEKEIQT